MPVTKATKEDKEFRAKMGWMPKDSKISRLGPIADAIRRNGRVSKIRK